MSRRENGSVVVQLKGRELPRSASGDAAFTSLEEIELRFEEEEIVALVNRAIYHMEYQREHHKKYTADLREKEKPVKAAAKRLFPGVAYINLTSAQYQACLDEAYPKVKEE